MWKSLFFYNGIWPTTREKFNAYSNPTDFVKFLGFDCLRNLEIILLVFDDPCKEVFKNTKLLVASKESHKDQDVFDVKPI